MRNSIARIAGAGLLALDVVCDEDSSNALTFAGGTCGNVLSILSYLNWDSTAVGFVGDDVAADRVVNDLIAVGVSAAYLTRSVGTRTPVFFQNLRQDNFGRVRHSFSRSCPRCGHDPGATHAPMATPIRQFTEAEAPDVFFMDRLSGDILSLAASAKAHGAIVVYEPSSESDIPYWPRAFELAQIVKYSGDRFRASEIEQFLSAASAPAWEIETHGEEGLRYRHRTECGGDTEWKTCAAIRAPRVVDTCGAGDWCTAGLLHGLITSGNDATTEDFIQAIRLGQAFAAWGCAFVGARGAMYCLDRSSAWSAITALVEGVELNLSDAPVRLPGSVAQRSAKRCTTWLCQEQ